MTKRAWLAAALLLAALPGAAFAQQAGQLGLGMMIGEPIGGTAKYFLTDKSALDFGIGYADDFTMIADYVWHGWQLLPQPKRGPLGLYFSVGPRVEFREDTTFGIRTMAGLSYWPKLKTRQAEFFFELGPVTRLAPDVGVRLDGEFGARLYFTPVK